MGFRVKIRATMNDLAHKTFKTKEDAQAFIDEKARKWAEGRYIIVPATLKESK